ncbi:MAG: hypothetical protein Sapg2KO_25270 [Saprospiraceae bacterium]
MPLWGKGQNPQLDSIYQLAQEYLSQKDSFLYGQTLYKIWDANPYGLSPEEIEVVKQKTHAFGVDYGFKPTEANRLLEEGRYEQKEIELYYQVQVLEEADPAWSYETVKDIGFSYNYTYPDLRPDTAHWMKIDLHGPANQPDTFLFRVGGRFRSWEQVNIYYEKGDSIIHQKLGYNKLSQEKTTTWSHNYFELPLQMDETITVYVRVAGKSSPYSASQLQLFYYPGARLIDRQFYSSDGQFPLRSVINTNYSSCSEYLHLLADSAGTLSLKEAQDRFRNEGGFANGTHTFERDKVYWGRMLLKGSDSFWGEQVFQIGGWNGGGFAKVDVYYKNKKGTPVHLKTGSSRPIFQKPIPYEVNLVDLKVPPRDTLEVLFRFEQKNHFFQKRSGREKDPLYIAHVEQSYQETILPWRTFRKGIILGGLGLLMIYLFLFFLFERSRLYLYLSLFVLGFFVYFFVLGPVAVDTGNVDWGLLRAMLSYVLGFVGFYLFTVEYLNLKALKKRLRHLLSGLFVIQMLLTLLMVYPILQGGIFPTWLTSSRMVFQVLFYVLCLVLAILSLLKGHRPAIFYLLAFAGFFFFVINTSRRFLMDSFQTSSMLYMNDQFEISILSIPVFLALGMGYRSRLIQEERAEAIIATEAAKVEATVAQEANETKSNFLSTVSHELRTPLTSIIGFANLNKRRLEEKLFPLIPKSDKKVERTMQQVVQNEGIIIQEGQRLADLINNLLDLAKIESGKIEWTIKSILPRDLVTRAEEASQGLFLERPSLSFVSEVSPDLPAFQGDFDRLLQVILNLISNAVKFTESGTVSLEVTQNAQSHLQFAVRDTGSGIPAEYQDKVFERFQQIEDQQAGKPKGTGLGLPICKEIVEYHGGKIWVESPTDFSQKASVGSTFYFTVPVKRSAIS